LEVNINNVGKNQHNDAYASQLLHSRSWHWEPIRQ